MAVNRFSPIQKLPEWQPQIPLELMTKALIYKQELFDKNKSLLQSNVQTAGNVADDILNEQAQKYAKEKVNGYKTYLNSNLAYADLTDESVMAQADTRLGDLANDDIFVNNVYITKKAKESMQKYREAKEKGDGSYSAANEWFTNKSIQKYVSADLNASKDSKIIGYTRNVDYLKIMQDALKDIKDFHDVEVQFNDNGFYFVKNKTEFLDADKVMARIKPYLTPEVEGQIYRDALYKNQDDESFFKTKAEQYKGSKEMIEQTAAKLKKEIAMNPANGKVVAQKREQLKQLDDQLSALNQELSNITNYSNLSEDEKNNYKVQAYRSMVLNNVVASHTYKRVDQDIEWNQFALKKYEQDRMDKRLEKEYMMMQPDLYQTSIENTEDLSSYGWEDYTKEREKSWQALQQTDVALAQKLEQLHVQAGGQAGSFFKDGQVNRTNFDIFLKTHQFGKFTGQEGNATMNMPAVKELMRQRSEAEKLHSKNQTMFQTALQQAAKEMGVYAIDPYQKFKGKDGKVKTMNSILAEAIGVGSLDDLDGDALTKIRSNKAAIIQKIKSQYGDGAANIASNFMNTNTKVRTVSGVKDPNFIESMWQSVTTPFGGNIPVPYTKQIVYSNDELLTRAANIMKANKQEQGPVGVGGIGMIYDKTKGKYTIDQRFGVQLAQAAYQSDKKELREIAGNIGNENSQVLAVYEKDGTYMARVAVPVKTASGEGNFATDFKTVDIPVKDPKMMATVQNFQLKQSDYTKRVENFLVPDPTRLNARTSTRSLAGALDSQDGYIKFVAEEETIGGVKSVSFTPLDNTTGHWNQTLGNALNTGVINTTPENIVRFFDWAEQNGHRQLGSYDISKLTDAFLQYSNTPVAGPEARVTKRTTKQKTASGTNTVVEKFNY